MGNYRKAIETILSRAKHRDEAVTEAVRERGGEEKCGGGRGGEGGEGGCGWGRGGKCTCPMPPPTTGANFEPSPLGLWFLVFEMP